MGGVTFLKDSSPTMIGPGKKCFYSLDGSTFSWPGSNCMYLVDIPGKFSWVNSRNGAIVPRAVTYGGKQVGQVTHLTQLRIGKVTNGFLFYTFSNIEHKASNYSVLIFTP